MFIYKIDYKIDKCPSDKRAVSKEYKTKDKAYNAMMKALNATDILNELGITDIAASGRIEEVSA